MKITNKHRLPRPVFNLADTQFFYQPGRMGVTTLQTPPGLFQLKLRHDDEIVEDAVDRMRIIFGKAIHKVLEEAAKDDLNLLAETKYTIEMDGWTIVCIGDLYEKDKKRLSDYKFTTVWKVVGGAPDDWVSQLNCNAYIYRKNGIPVDKLEVFAILDHWTKARALQGGNYPPRDAKKFIIPMWSNDKIETYLHERIAAHKAAEKLPDAELPPCTPEERWTKKPTYKVMREDRKTSMRNLDTKEQAEAFVKNEEKKFISKKPNAKLPKFDIVLYPGEETRCESGKFPGHHYCNVKWWCPFWQKLQKNKGV